jgi:hypothetical protein
VVGGWVLFCVHVHVGLFMRMLHVVGVRSCLCRMTSHTLPSASFPPSMPVCDRQKIAKRGGAKCCPFWPDRKAASTSVHIKGGCEGERACWGFNRSHKTLCKIQKAEGNHGAGRFLLEPCHPVMREARPVENHVYFSEVSCSYHPW